MMNKLLKKIFSGLLFTLSNRFAGAAQKGFTSNRFAGAAQKGFTLIEMAVVMLIAGILLSSFAMLQQVQSDDAEAKRVANEILSTHTALESYANLYYDNLTSATPVNMNNWAVFAANVYAPTLAELKAMGYLVKYQENVSYSWAQTPVQAALPNGLPSKTGTWRFVVNKIPAGCADADCDLELITYLDRPATHHNDSIADEGFLSKIASFGGAKIGYSTVNAPTLAKGPNGLWSVNNPTNTPGVLFARSTVSSLGVAHFARVLDSRPLVVGGNLTVLGSSVFDDINVVGAFKNVAPANPVPGDGGGFVVSTGLVTGTTLKQTNIVAAGNPGTLGSGLTTGNTNYAVPQGPCGPIGSTGIAATGELYTCRYNVAMGGYWILTSEPDCQIPAGGTGTNTSVNFGIQSFIVSSDRNIQIPYGCYYTKFTFSDAYGNFAANDFMTFTRSSSLAGQIVQSYMNMFTNEAIIMDVNQQIIAHQTAKSNAAGAAIKIKVDIAKD